MSFKRPKYHLQLIFLFSTLLLQGLDGYGQGDQVRRYATRQHQFTTVLLNSVTNGNLAVNGSPQTRSNLNILISTLNVGPEQVLDYHSDPSSTSEYQTMIPGSKPITVKFATPAGLLAIGLTYEIQAVKRMRDRGVLGGGWTYENVGPRFQGDIGLLSLLGGVGDNEVTIIPGSDYQGVRVKIFTSVLGAAASAGVYHAYIMEDGPAMTCEDRNTPIDVLSGTRSNSISALTSLGGVSDPYNAINGNVTDHATMNVGVGALNTIYLNTVFPTPSQAGQRIRIILDDPGGLLNLGLLSSFSIQPMLREANAGPPLASSGSILSLRLLPGTTKYELAYTINSAFDRVELRFDNTVAALASLKVYEVSRAPRVMLIENPTLLSQSMTGCGQVNLTNAIANYQPDQYTYNFYNVATGGTPMSSSIVTSSGTYYMEAIDPASGCATARVPVTANVIPPPTITLSTIATICKGENTSSLDFSNITGGGNQYSITWDVATPGLNNTVYTVLPGNGKIEFTGLSAIPQGAYTGKFKIRNSTTGCESIEIPITLTIAPLPRRANLSITQLTN